MKRRDHRLEFVLCLVGAVFTSPALAQTSEKIPRVGILSPADSDSTPIFQAFRQGLRDSASLRRIVDAPVGGAGAAAGNRVTGDLSRAVAQLALWSLASSSAVAWHR